MADVLVRLKTVEAASYRLEDLKSGLVKVSVF